ncbi:MAG: tyrosine-type recombinase/integrase [Methyloprofundus sp.]|nr:tyrosine-type recombinase/integrase [Methyloprofundus sp.]
MTKETTGQVFTDTWIKKLKASEKPITKSDMACKGLYIKITPAGSKKWLYRYHVGKQSKWLTLGDYPATSLAQARAKVLEQEKLKQSGIDPIEERKQVKAVQQQQAQIESTRISFSQVAKLWLEQMHKTKSFKYVEDIGQRIEKHLLPKIGEFNIDEINTRQLIQAFKSIEQTGRLETLKRIQQYANKIFLFGIGAGYCDNNPTANVSRDLFAKPDKGHYAHTTESKVLAQILRALDDYAGDISTVKALQMQPYVFLRSVELAAIRWDEIDLDRGVIEISAERMKKKRPHLVPISAPVREIIETMRPISGDSEYLFPSPKTLARPINEQSLNAGMHRMGFKNIQTFHGFRHTASTLLNEMGYMGDVIEKQLAHEQRGVRAVYNKAQYLAQRTEMMNGWADYLNSLKMSPVVIPINRRA